MIWLLGIDRESAIDFDAVPRDSLAQYGESLSGNAEESVFAIARWNDVHAARRRITRSKVEAEILELRSQAFTEHEIAKMVGLGRLTVRRKYRASLDELLDALGEQVEPPRLSVVSACLSCAARPRVRLAAVEVERWTCMGRRRRDDGKLAQAWWTPGGIMELWRPPLARSARPGAAYDVVTTQGEVLSFSARKDEALSADDGRVRAWVVDTAAAVEGNPPTWQPDLHPRVLAPRRVAEPEKQAGSCAECVMPQLHARVIRPRRREQ